MVLSRELPPQPELGCVFLHDQTVVQHRRSILGLSVNILRFQTFALRNIEFTASGVETKLTNHGIQKLSRPQMV